MYFECDCNWKALIWEFFYPSFCSTSLNVLYIDLAWYRQCPPLINFWIDMLKHVSSTAQGVGEYCWDGHHSHHSSNLLISVRKLWLQWDMLKSVSVFLLFPLTLMVFAQRIRYSVFLWHLVVFAGMCSSVQTFQGCEKYLRIVKQSALWSLVLLASLN